MSDQGKIKTFELKSECRIGSLAVDGIRQSYQHACDDAAQLLPGCEFTSVSVERVSVDMIEITRTYRIRINCAASQTLAENISRHCRLVAEEEI